MVTMLFNAVKNKALKAFLNYKSLIEIALQTLQFYILIFIKKVYFFYLKCKRQVKHGH